MLLRSIFLGAAGAAALASAASAENLTIEMSGVITRLSNFETATFEIGDPVRVVVVIESDAAGTVGPDNFARYSPTSMTLTLPTPTPLTLVSSGANPGFGVANDCTVGCVNPGVPPADIIQISGLFDGPPFQPSLNIPFIDFDGAILNERSLSAALQYLAAGDLSGLELRDSSSVQLINSGVWGSCIDNTPGVRTCQAAFRIETVSVRPTEIDTDADGVLDTADLCPGTTIPEAAPTSGVLGNGRHALTVAGSFDFTSGKSANGTYTTANTAGCSCEQIVDELFLGAGHLKNGCSNSVMRTWVDGLPFDPNNP